jgi:hypothetical protein
VINIFYFVNGFLQMIPAIQTNGPLATFIPLSFVIIVGIIKEAIVDFRRYKADNETNGRKCLKYDRDTE